LVDAGGIADDSELEPSGIGHPPDRVPRTLVGAHVGDASQAEAKHQTLRVGEPLVTLGGERGGDFALDHVARRIEEQALFDPPAGRRRDRCRDPGLAQRREDVLAEKSGTPGDKNGLLAPRRHESFLR